MRIPDSPAAVCLWQTPPCLQGKFADLVAFAALWRHVTGALCFGKAWNRGMRRVRIPACIVADHIPIAEYGFRLAVVASGNSGAVLQLVFED